MQAFFKAKQPPVTSSRPVALPFSRGSRTMPPSVLLPCPRPCPSHQAVKSFFLISAAPTATPATKTAGRTTMPVIKGAPAAAPDKSA